MQYQIKRKGFVVASIRPEGQQEREIMLKDIVPITFTSADPIHFQIGDTMDVYGEMYYLNQLDEPTKDSTMSYKYSMTFQAAYYSLAKPRMFFYDDANQLKVSNTEIMTNASQMLDLIVANANRTQSGWLRGDCIDSEFKMIAFDGETVLTALDNVAKEFNTEWWVKGKVIHLVKFGTISGHKFEYGYNKGLRGGLTRTNVDSTSVFSRLYVTGSDQNLPAKYRNGQKNLMLPEVMEFIQGPKYGDDEIEATINFPDIKPERIGSVTSVATPFVFSDLGIDFDLNTQLLPNVSAKVSFITGNLAGYNFEIAKNGYNHGTRTVTIIKNEAEKALELPSDLMKPAVGDTYFFFDIVMPVSYRTDAEYKLLNKGTEYFNEQSVPRVAYDVPPDHFFFKRNNITLSLGDYVHITDFDLRLNKDIRINSYNRDLHDPYKYSNLKISDMPIGSAYIRQIAEAEKVTKALNISQINNIQRSRSNWRSTNELATLLDTLRAEMLLIMIDGGAYTTNIIATTTVNNFQTTSGNVYHEQYKENDGIWHVPPFESSLAENKPYYVYIKASRFSTGAEIRLSESKIAAESNPAYYYFPFGIISSIFEGMRILSSTRGYTKVTGGSINTGRIVSNDEMNYLDLDTGTFNLGDDVSGMDYGVSEPKALTIKGKVFAATAEFINLFVQNLKTKLTGRRMEIIAETNSQTFYDASDRALTTFKDDVDDFIDDDSATTFRKLSGMTFNKYYSSNPSNPDIVKITGNGVYSNTGYSQIALNSIGWFGFGSIVGYIRRPIANLSAGDIHSAVIGVSGVTDGFGGYFRHNFNGVSLYVDGTIKVKKGDDEMQGKSGYIRLSAPNETGRYIGFRVMNGLIVEESGLNGYSETTQTPGLS